MWSWKPQPVIGALPRFAARDPTKSKPGKRDGRPLNSYDNFAEPIVRLHLRPAFGHTRAARLTTTVINRYRDDRLEAEAAPATINREMAMLKRALNLGRISTPPKVLIVPHIPMFEEDNTRTGFYEHEEFTALRAAIEEALRPAVTFAYYTGCRRGEILSLQWPQVQLEQRTVILEPGTTKNKDGRILPLHGELYQVLVMQKVTRDQKCPDCPWVFFRVKDGRGIRIVEVSEHLGGGLQGSQAGR